MEECGPTVERRVSRLVTGNDIEHTHLDLQKVVATNALVVHLVVSVIGVTAALVLNKCKAVRSV